MLELQYRQCGGRGRVCPSMPLLHAGCAERPGHMLCPHTLGAPEPTDACMPVCLINKMYICTYSHELCAVPTRIRPAVFYSFYQVRWITYEEYLCSCATGLGALYVFQIVMHLKKNFDLGLPHECSCLGDSSSSLAAPSKVRSVSKVRTRAEALPPGGPGQWWGTVRVPWAALWCGEQWIAGLSAGQWLGGGAEWCHSGLHRLCLQVKGERGERRDVLGIISGCSM